MYRIFVGENAIEKYGKDFFDTDYSYYTIFIDDMYYDMECFMNDMGDIFFSYDDDMCYTEIL